MKTSQETKNIAAALAKAQAQLAPVLKNSQGYGYKYAALDAVMNSARDALNANGLAITQGVESRDGGWFCQTVLLHASGETIATECPIFFKADKKLSDAQAFGSAYTYARRYSFQALLGIAPEDDDGRSAGRNTQHPRNNQQREPYPQEYPAVAAPPKIVKIFNLTSMPTDSAYLSELSGEVDISNKTPTREQILNRAKETLADLIRNGEGADGPELEQRLRNMWEVDDLVQICRGVDVLR